MAYSTAGKKGGTKTAKKPNGEGKPALKREAKKPAAKTRTSTSPVDLVVDKINKALKGAAVVRKASDRTYSYNIRRPFGILSLDLATGGGLPAGSICQLFGPEGVGKNYLMNCLIRECQKHYGDDAIMAFTSFEYGYDKAFGWHCGVSAALSDDELSDYVQDIGRDLTPKELKELTDQVGRFYIIDTGAEGKDMPAEAKFEAVLEIIGSGLFQIVFIDGLGAFLGQGQRMKGDAKRRLFEDKKVAENAGLMTNFLGEAFTLLGLATDDGGMNQTTLVMNNQQRANITTGMNPYQARHAPKIRVGGGFALGHAKAIDIHLRPAGRIKRTDKVVGKEIAWNLNKGKLGTHEGKSGNFDYLFASGVDWKMDVIATARAMKVIKARGPKIYVPGNDEGMGKEALEKYYAEGPEQDSRIAELAEACLKEASLTVRYR